VPRRVLVPLDLPPAVRLPPQGSRIHALGGRTMGTTWSAKFVLPPFIALDAVQRAVEGVLARVIAEMSTWVADSDISQFNKAEPGAWRALAPGLHEVLRYALSVAADTGGCYDPTVGALVDLWGFGPPGPRSDPPGENEIAAALACGGFRHLSLEADGRARQPGGMRLDLSSVAKGYAVDRVAAAVAALGVTDHLVEIGGELTGRGAKPDGSPWWVVLEEPASVDGPGAIPAETIVALHGLSIATSGDAQRAFERDGRRYSHTVDPRTGWPVPDRLVAVTVLHRSCMQADALATALTVMGPEAGLAYARANGLTARFVVRVSRGFEEHVTPAFAAMAD
jgi:thiamine biosynthesis lipoprotein